MFSDVNRIPECIGQTDRQSCHGTVRAMHTRRTVKTNEVLQHSCFTPKNIKLRLYKKLSYRKQIARRLCTQYVEGIYSNSVTLKSRLGITQSLETAPFHRSHTSSY